MYKIVQGSTHNLADVDAFLNTLNTLAQNPVAEARQLFEPGADLVVTRAPGRLDVMGGIADYSGSLVLQLPTREATLVALQRSSSPELRIVSLRAEGNERTAYFEMPLADFMAGGQPVSYEVAFTYFRQEPATRWAAYIAGVFLVLMHERGVSFSGGARLLIDSELPEGKGVASSAAVEVAVMQAVATAFGLTLEPRELALLCQKVENLVVGAPCGIMDQMTAAAGKADHLMALLCQPAELRGMLPLPDELAIWGLDSGVRHSVSGADYGSVRIGTFMGYRIIAEQAQLEVRPQGPGMPVEVVDPNWGGYLANLTPSEYDQSYRARLPRQMPGDEFLERYHNTTDPMTMVEPRRVYPVRVPAGHPIYEHFRVRTFAELLRGAPEMDDRRLALLGELMYQSHASYSACDLGSGGTDRLVQFVRAAGARRGLYGAKITGGGSGGTVAVLGRREAITAVAAVARKYARDTGYQPQLFAGSSPGAAEFGHLELKWE